MSSKDGLYPASYTLRKAEEATKLARAAMRRAVETLERQWMSNGYGIFADVGEIESIIHVAISDLKKARECLTGMKWPTDATYDAYEREVAEQHRLEDEAEES